MKGKTMKSPITNQPSPKDSKMRGQLTHANAAVAGAVAILLLGMMAASGGQKAAPSTQIRPIEDFLDAQGTLNGAPYYIAAELSSAGWTDPKTERFAQVDFTGLANKWIVDSGGKSLGTKTEGKVIERPLPDGRAEVTVLLHTKNALTWVVEPWAFNPYGDPLVFGHRAQDVLDGEDPALGESFYKWVFINKKPGAPLPDQLAEIVLGPSTVETLMLSFEANADGTLRDAFGVPDGTPGRVQVTQTCRFSPGRDASLAGGWPVEHINLKVVGR
jgi:hypothetical protein